MLWDYHPGPMMMEHPGGVYVLYKYCIHVHLCMSVCIGEVYPKVAIWACRVAYLTTSFSLVTRNY